jgi:hypothetical protein
VARAWLVMMRPPAVGPSIRRAHELLATPNTTAIIAAISLIFAREKFTSLIDQKRPAGFDPHFSGW